MGPRTERERSSRNFNIPRSKPTGERARGSMVRVWNFDPLNEELSATMDQSDLTRNGLATVHLESRSIPRSLPMILAPRALILAHQIATRLIGHLGAVVRRDAEVRHEDDLLLFLPNLRYLRGEVFAAAVVVVVVRLLFKLDDSFEVSSPFFCHEGCFFSPDLGRQT
ncbi:unnamed protein product [Dibothriocephalus latus]|uniref:Uncharacterized protein n=1 Tax=Dibothriocephalus latus TaxID=60516 RepID=A0A3P7PWB0_DIBLA|nr:unnamed protein product [Dibothriocephalus latus]